MNHIKFLIYSLFFALFFLGSANAQTLSLKSPNEKIKIEINTIDQLSMTVFFEEKQIIKNTALGLKLGDGRVFGLSPKLKSSKVADINEITEITIPNKDKVVKNTFSQMTLNFRQNYQVIFRAYDDGIAYRFVDRDTRSKNVISEKMNLSLPEGATTYFAWEQSMYSNNERLYNNTSVSKLKEGDFCSLPVLFESQGIKFLFTETSVFDYPIMYLEKTARNNFSPKIPKFVLEAAPNEAFSPDRNQIITKEADYIAEISGKKAYPWRLFIISDQDATFVESNLVAQLSGKSKIEDPSWIKPGKVAWDWWNANNITGVDFRAGINQETYKYYIDFAAENDIEYVILDEGWTKSTTEIYESNPEIDIKKLIEYGRQKDVGIILWVLWKPLDDDTDGLLKLYSDWGAVGIKVDFMQRGDQYMVNSYERIAKVAAKYKLLVDYHGAFKPAGIERIWPNLVTYEGVMGNEQVKWQVRHFPYSETPFPINPEHNLTIPFIRMAAGPMDYTPGAMTNVNNPRNMKANFIRPMTLGTRAHQVAMYTVFESPIQMLCDAPSVYKKEQETVNFIKQIPTTWDETHVLEAALSDYLVVARKKDEMWFLGAMTDDTKRSFDVKLSFLEPDTPYQVQVYRDGINADKNAIDYSFEIKQLDSNSTINIPMASGGGYSAIFKKN
tara:strand:- start:864 stop:2870 length:2007 start_codon:yes stop_codon:yes gene_type:complete